jgi:hypothetical protein
MDATTGKRKRRAFMLKLRVDGHDRLIDTSKWAMPDCLFPFQRRIVTQRLLCLG